MANEILKKGRLKKLATPHNKGKFAHALREYPYNPLLAAQSVFGETDPDLCCDVAATWIHDDVVRNECIALAKRDKAKKSRKKKDEVPSHDQLAREIYEECQKDMDPKTKATMLDLLLKCTAYPNTPLSLIHI